MCFLFAAWFYSICVRIVLVQVRRYLLAISALMVLWILLRSVKFSVDNMDAERWLWYFYYLPLLFIPLLSVLFPCRWGRARPFGCRYGQGFCIFRRCCCSCSF